jgi:hypothetical protein
MADHARFSPSASARWMTCAASYPLNRDLPRTTSKYASEGTAAHTLGQRALTYRKPCTFWLGEQIEADGIVFIVDENMASYVQAYVDYVFGHEKYGSTLLIEQQISFSESIGVPDQFGTSDAILLSPDGKHLDVFDLKYGQGERVDAEENTQGLTYATGVLETFDVIFPDVETITVHIVQPRLDHITTFETDRARIAKHIEDLRAAAQACLGAEQEYDEDGVLADWRYTVSDKACRWCGVKATCEAIQRKVAESVYGDFEALDEPEARLIEAAPKVPAGERLGKIFGVLDLIEDWARAVRGEVERMVMGGMTVIGVDGQPMKLIEGKKGNRKWDDPALVEGILVGLLPPEKAYKPRELITPSVADKLLNKKATKAQWETLTPFITQEPGRPKVALGSHPGEPYNPASTADEFSDLGAA